MISLQCKHMSIRVILQKRKKIGSKSLPGRRKVGNMKEVSSAEWNIMESLWADAPKVGSQIVADMAERTGWSRSTTLTMLRRMTDKGLIACEDNGQMKTYSPLLVREDAVKSETESFLNRVYNGSISMLVSSFAEKKQLSKEDIEELRRILDNAQTDDM